VPGCPEEPGVPGFPGGPGRRNTCLLPRY
jgi:hypothetical protein